MSGKIGTISSRRLEALDQFEDRAGWDLAARTAQSLVSRTDMHVDAFDRTDPDSSLQQAKTSIESNAGRVDSSKFVLREIGNTRKRLLSAGCDVVGEGTLVTLKGVDDTTLVSTYLIVPNGSGNKILLNDGTRVTCVSPQAPLAESLIGKKVGEEVDTACRHPERERIMQIVTIE